MQRPTTAALALLCGMAIVACGGTDAPPATVPAGDRQARERTGQIEIAVLGDSITAGSPLWDPDPDVREAIGPALDRRSQFELWASRENPALSFRNCGVFGERTDQIALRLTACATGADALIVQGGINDIAQGRSVEAAADDLREIVRAGLDAGLEVAIADVLPWNNGHPAADRPIAELNGRIAEIAREEGVPLLPFHDALEDPTEPGTMGAELTIDGDHPSPEGYRRIAREAVVPNFP